MNILLLDQTACFVDFALRCRAAGHYPKVCMARDKETKQRSKTGDGLIEKIEGEDWQRHMKWADLILTSDNTRWLRELDVYRKKGFPIFAPSYASAELELDREKGQALFQKAGIKIMPFEAFSDYGKAKKHVMAEMKRFVSKPKGDAERELSYVSKGPRDMLYMLGVWEKSNKLKSQFMLQEFVKGTEIAVGGWLGKNGFAEYVMENFEHKPLMNDNIGPNTGEMGTAVKYTNDSALFREVLLPMERDLIKLGHTGYVDVAVIVDEDGYPRPLEFTCRPGWPLFNIQQHLHPDPCEWMCDLLDGQDTFKPNTDVAIGVVMAIKSFPHPPINPNDSFGVPIYGLNDENPYRSQISPCEVMAGTAPDGDPIDLEAKCIVSAGEYVCVCSGVGSTVREAKDEAYECLESVSIPSSPKYRTDIGDRLKKDIPALQEQGFCADWRY